MADEQKPVEEKRPVGRPRKNLPSTPIDAQTAAKIKRLQARAEAAREMRRAAPASTVSGRVTIPQKDIINRVAKETGGQDGEWHWTFQDRRDEDKLVALGYEPGMNPETGKWEKFQGDPLWRCKTEDFEQSLKDNKAASDAMLGAKLKADAAQTGEKVTAQKVTL